MSSSCTTNGLKDHVLFKLQDKVSNMSRGFAFVKIDPGFDNSGGGFDFLPVSNNITTAMNGEQAEMIRLLAEAINEDESLNYEGGDVDVDLEEDLNLSEASSTNDTTLDECRSVSSFLSPKMPPVILNEDSSLSSIQSTGSVAKVEQNENTWGNKKDPVVKIEEHGNEVMHIKSENVFSPVVGSPRCVSLASFTVASLAAEVVSEINANEKKDESGLIIKKDKMLKSISTERDDEVEEHFRSRNLKEVLNEEEFNKFLKPFSLGWKRECVVKENYLISDIYYITPPCGKMQGKRIRKPSLITKFLSEEGHGTNLVLENFSFKRAFLGFESRHESIRRSLNKPKPSLDNKKYENFFEIIAKDKYRCLLCGSLITVKGNMARHVKMVHEPDVNCEICGKEIRAVHIQNHQANCTAESKDTNDNDINGSVSVKRKASEVSVISTEKLKRFTEPGSPIDSIPVMKSSPTTYQGSTIWTSPLTSEESTEAKTEDYCEIIEPDDPSFSRNTSELKLAKTDEHALDQHDYNFTNPHSTEGVTESFIGDHSGSQMPPPQDQLPVPQEIGPDIDSNKESESIPMVSLEMSSVEGSRVKMQVKVNTKVAKCMKKFGKRMGVGYHDLRFILNGEELTGDELAEGLDGAKILVERREG